MTQGLSHGNVVSEKPGSENYEALEQDTGADEIDDNESHPDYSVDFNNNNEGRVLLKLKKS